MIRFAHLYFYRAEDQKEIKMEPKNFIGEALIGLLVLFSILMRKSLKYQWRARNFLFSLC